MIWEGGSFESKYVLYLKAATNICKKQERSDGRKEIKGTKKERNWAFGDGKESLVMNKG